MINTEGVVLNLLLHTENRDSALTAYSKIREKYFSPAFVTIYKHIKTFYDTQGYVPNISELQVYRSRDIRTQTALSSLELVPTEGIELDLAVEAMIDHFAQDTTLDMLNDFLEKVSLMDRMEIQNCIANIPIKLDEELASTEGVHTANTMSIFVNPADSTYNEVMGGISNQWDAQISYRRQELALFGGKRGSGKSLLCANLVVQQMVRKNLGVYMTIEMTYQETFERMMAIRAQVPYQRIRQNDMTDDDVRKLARVKADMYDEGDEVYDKYFTSNIAPNRYEFEEELRVTCKLKEEGRLIIIDDRALSISSIDVQISKLKAQYGDKLELVVVDYLNQIVIEGHENDMYDWKLQIIISKQLKNLARKYDILIASPYQMDDDGGTRFSKGILDACDTAQLIIAHDKDKKAITLSTTKARGGNDEIDCTVGMDWDTLTIDPTEIQMPEDKPEETKEDEDSPFQVPKGAMELT